MKISLPVNATFTFQYASIKPGWDIDMDQSYNKFTFQYASIKPISLRIGIKFRFKVYISICFY
ncbi:hypothetical protein HMPREF1152_1401 [Mogibacterium sp. CM50]|nr:hypothetical protein HMPREF1152_1401 [Mogibacterium sp. CM50]